MSNSPRDQNPSLGSESSNIDNPASNQGAQGVFHAPVTINKNVTSLSSPEPPAYHQPREQFLYNLLVALTLLMAVGVPVAGVFIFSDRISRNFWLALGCVIFYEMALLVLRAFLNIWLGLEQRWIDKITDRIDMFLHRSFSEYKQRYVQYLVYHHRFLDVKGLTTQGPYSLMLDRVFVELSLVPQPSHQTSTDPINYIPKALIVGHHQIWKYLDSESIQHVAIIGPPGSGKTTLLKNVTITLASHHLTKVRTDLPHKLPILLFIRDHSQTIKTRPNISLVQLLTERLASLEGPMPPSGWFEKQLADGNCIIMLDGLDEVAESTLRHLVVNWVERQMRIHGRNRFIITSRPFGYQSNPLSDVTLLQVRPFTMQQIHHFVHNWYIANEIMSTQKDDPGVRMIAKQGAIDLLQRLHNTPTLSDLAVNPLLLTMIANVHRYRSTLPGRRVELYYEICEVFLGKRQQARGLVLELTPSQKQSVLQVLAYHMMCQGLREMHIEDIVPIIKPALELVDPQATGEEFLKMVENSSGLLLERENGVYSFAHKTFQEYLASVYIREHNLERVLTLNVSNSWWHETIRLYVAQADATSIIAACISNEQQSVEALILALECREEAKQIQLEMRNQLDAVLALDIEGGFTERKRTIVATLLALRLRRMAWLDEQRFIDRSLITQAEYQLFLEALRTEGQYYQPDHWARSSYPQDEGNRPVLGVRPSDVAALCDWLTKREGDEWYYRLPLADEVLSTNERPAVFDSLPAGLGFWVKVDTERTSLTLDSSKSIRVRNQIEHQYKHIVDLAIKEDVSRAYVLAQSNELEIVLEQLLNRIEELEDAFERIITHNFDITYNNARILAQDLVRDLEPIAVIFKTRNDFGSLDIVDNIRDLVDIIYEFTNSMDNTPYKIYYIRRQTLIVKDILKRKFEESSTLTSKLDLLKTANATKIVNTEDKINEDEIADITKILSEHITARLKVLHYALNIDDIQKTRDKDPISKLNHALSRDLSKYLKYEGIRSITLMNAIGFAYNRLDIDRSEEENNISEGSLSEDTISSSIRKNSKKRDDINNNNQIIEPKEARSYLRFCSLILIVKLVEQLDDMPTPLLKRLVYSIDGSRSELQQYLNSAIDLYASCVVLEERINGSLQPFEGILIARERKEM